MKEGEAIKRNKTRRYLGISLNVTIDYVQVYKRQKIFLDNEKLKATECSDTPKHRVILSQPNEIPLT